MAWSWANVLVAPTASSGLTVGSFADVDENPPWSDADFCYLQLASLASGTSIFSAFNLSNAGGEKKGFWITARMAINSTEGFNVVITVKQGATTLWTSASFTVIQAINDYKTYQFRIPDSAFSSNPNIDNMSIEFAATNIRTANQRLLWSFVRLSKTPFTTAQQAILPSTLVGQDFVCYRASDLGVLGAVDAENIVVLPDASGNGRHAYLRLAATTYETDAPTGLLADTARFAGSLGYNDATDAIITWAGNFVFHTKVYPTSVATDVAISSGGNTPDFIDSTIPGQKHLIGVLATGPAWVIMSGDGTGPAHLNGGTVATSAEQRVTLWVQNSGNEKLWEEADVSPVVNGASGANPFYSWSLLNRETDDRSFVGRLMEWWAVEGTGVTEAEIDTARGEWLNGIVTNTPFIGLIIGSPPYVAP